MLARMVDLSKRYPARVWVLVACLALVGMVLVGGLGLHVHVTRNLSIGDLTVSIGTFALAVFTASLATATYSMDLHAAQREQRQYQRELRGVARLIDGQLEAVQRSWELADGGSWRRSFPNTPRRLGQLRSHLAPERGHLAGGRAYADSLLPSARCLGDGGCDPG